MIKNLIYQRKKRFGIFASSIETFIKYGLINKILETVLIFPLFFYISGSLVGLGGFEALTYNRIFGFIFSKIGIVFCIFSLLIVSFVGLLEIGGYTIISWRALKGEKEPSYKNIFLFNLKMLPKMLNPGAILFVLNLAVFVPLAGIGVSLSIFKNFTVPNFIMSVINENIFYLLIFYIVTAFFAFFSIISIFSFQFLIIYGLKPLESIKRSYRLVRENFKNIFADFFTDTVIILTVIFILDFLWINFVHFMAFCINSSGSHFARYLMLFLLYLEKTVLYFGYFIFVPLEVFLITLVFEKYDNYNIKNLGFEKNKVEILEKKTGKSILDIVFSKKERLVVLYIISALCYTVFCSIFFDDIFRINSSIFIVGHRGGSGQFTPENTITSIHTGIKDGATYVEVDVQRTRDGKYILSHDNTFKRTASVNKKASEMNLEQIKKLDVGKNFSFRFKGQRVPTVEEVFLDSKKRDYGIFLELKGETADEKMADEMVRLIKKYGLENSVIIMSLDYDLVRYTEEKYPGIKTGFVYFFALGDMKNFKCDYIIFEEKLGTNKNIDKIHSLGKKAVVWTVNTKEDMQKFLHSDVDGIITDNTKLLHDLIINEMKRSDMDILLEKFVI